MEYVAVALVTANFVAYCWGLHWSYQTWTAWKRVSAPKPLTGHVTVPTDHGGLT